MNVSAGVSAQQLVEHLFRHGAGQMHACLTRIFGLEHLDLVEDAVQDALLKALHLWPYHGVPANPSAWIIQVAKNRALDILRRKRTWAQKEDEVQRMIRNVPEDGPAEQAAFTGEFRDDQLQMVFACCHPALPREAQVALTLKTVGGFSVSEVARAFLARKSAMGQRLVRAKQTLRQVSARMEIPFPGELPQRLDAVLEVIYLMFNEGYAALKGEALVRRELCQEAIRLCELLLENPAVARPKVHALAALLLFQASRLAARTDTAGDLLLLREQDRSFWDRGLVAAALRHLETAGQGSELTTYHLQAEIAACHALAKSDDDPDWPRILECYDALEKLDPSPVIALNRVVAVAQVHGPGHALCALEPLAGDASLAGYYPAYAIRGDLLAKLDRRVEAAEQFKKALRLASSVPVQRYLRRRLEELSRFASQSQPHRSRPC